MMRATVCPSSSFPAAVFALSLSLMSFAAWPDTPNPTRQHELQGIIRDASGKPVRGARVHLVPVSPTKQVKTKSTKTDKQGNYDFDGEASGAYTLQIDKLSLSSVDAAVTLAQGATLTRDITALAQPSASAGNIAVRPSAPITVNGDEIIVRFDVGTDGKAFNFQVIQSSGNSDLDLAAVNDCKAARWKPAIQNGKPVITRFEHTFDISSGS